MSTLERRVASLEERGGNGLVLLALTTLPKDAPERATHGATEFVQAAHESSDEFRARVVRDVGGARGRVILVDEMDAAL